MNLSRFMKAVDMALTDLSAEDMKSFVHQIARGLPESGRGSFLKRLESLKGEDSVELQKRVEKDSAELHAEVERIKKVLSEIDEGNRCLDSEINEEWDDWYDNEEDEFLFTDPEDLLKDLQDSIELIHRCFDEEEYKDGCELAELLSVLQIYVNGEYIDYDGSTLNIQELFDLELLSGSFIAFLRESLYLTYMGNELQYKADKLFRMMSNYRCFDVKLEDLMQMGEEELHDLQEFIPSWIDYLGRQEGPGAEKLLLEVWEMVDADDQHLEMARSFASQHPELYRRILEEGIGTTDPDKMYLIGMEALENIPVSYEIRGEVALLTAEYAEKINKHDSAESCWLEAFRSNTTVLNYLRLRCQTREWSKYAERVREIYETLFGNLKNGNRVVSYGMDGLKRNALDRNTYLMILFFEEKFSNMIKLGMKETRPLGWSYTFMKEGLSLLLLLLFKGKTLHAGMRAMLNRVQNACGFTLEEYERGTIVTDNERKADYFLELFQNWKKDVVISDEDEVRWMNMIERLISLRTSGIMEANRRNYYHECAQFIAAFGEVKESRGETGAKQQFMRSYRELYPRRRNFIADLKACGMKA